MSDAERPAVDPALGAAVEDATATVLDREPEADPEEVRSTLEAVADDGTVSRGGVNAALGELAQYVATPENRLESTREALDAARTAAEPAAELGSVRLRLDDFEATYGTLEAEVESLVERLNDLVERGNDPADVYELAGDVRDLKWEVREVHGDIEEFRSEVESFERWANTPETRFDELDADVDHVENVLDGLATLVDGLEAGTHDERESAVVWADAVLQCSVAELLLDDLRAELSDLRAWPGSEPDGRGEPIESRLDDLRGRRETLRERLGSLGRPALRERFGERIDEFEATTERFDPPVRWDRVQETLAEHREALGAQD